MRECQQRRWKFLQYFYLRQKDTHGDAQQRRMRVTAKTKVIGKVVLQFWHVPRKCWKIWKEHEKTESIWRYLHWNWVTWTKPWNTSRDNLTLIGLVQWRRKHILHCVTLINFSWRVNVEDTGLLLCPVENQKCVLLVHCRWFSHKPLWKKLDHHSCSTARAVATKPRASRNEDIPIHSRFGIFGNF